MSLTLEQTEGHSVLHLTESVGISCAAELHRLLLEAVGTNRSIEIALEPSAELDISAIQLLYAARSAAARQGFQIAVSGKLPEGVAAAFRDAGLDPFSPLAEQA